MTSHVSTERDAPKCLPINGDPRLMPAKPSQPGRHTGSSGAAKSNGGQVYKEKGIGNQRPVGTY